MAAPTGWAVAAASVRGKSHEESGSVCQDSHYVESSSDGLWLAVAVSDGAGTADRSDESSRLVCRSFAKFLLAQAPKLQRQPPGDWLIDAILRHVLDFRESLRLQCGSEDIRQYHCTVLAALLGPTGGISVHIGDGALFGGSVSRWDHQTVGFSAETWVSNPENGEYANETFFITEKSWVKHLRVVPLPKLDWLVVGTDGGTALALDSKDVPKTGFVLPVFEELLGKESDTARAQRLSEIMSDRQADRVTGDDKTLVFAFRRGITRFHGHFETAPATATPIPEAVKTNPASGTDYLKIIDAKQSVAVLPNPANRGRRWRNSLKLAGVFLVFGLAPVYWGWDYSKSGQLLPSFLRSFHFKNKIADAASAESAKLAGRTSHSAGAFENIGGTSHARADSEISPSAGNQNGQEFSRETQVSANVALPVLPKVIQSARESINH